MPVSNGPAFMLTLELIDTVSLEQSSSAYSVKDQMTQCGGMANALIKIGTLLMNFLQDQLLQSSLIKEIYQVE